MIRLPSGIDSRFVATHITGSLVRNEGRFVPEEVPSTKMRNHLPYYLIMASILFCGWMSFWQKPA